MITDSKKEYAWGKKNTAYNGAQTVLKTKKKGNKNLQIQDWLLSSDQQDISCNSIMIEVN